MNSLQEYQASDGSTSTNYGPTFEITSTAIHVLRMMKDNRDYETWMNYAIDKKFGDWDDLVSKEGREIVCVQLKHTKDMDNDKLQKYLKQREGIVRDNPDDQITFVLLATTPDNAIRNKYQKIEPSSIPACLKSLITKDNAIYFDEKNKQWPTYFCMNQNDVKQMESKDLQRAIQDYIGKDFLSHDHLDYVQTKFLEFVRARYLRKLKGADPLTNDEVSTELSYAVLGKFKIEYKPGGGSKPKTFSNQLEKLIGSPSSSSVVIVNHAVNSGFKDKVWYHLMVHLKKEPKQDTINNLWMEGALHAPLVSDSKDTDRTILRALEMSNFKPKVLVFRLRPFSIRPGQTIVTLLQNLEEVPDDLVQIQTEQIREDYRYARVSLAGVANAKLHHDSFAGLFKTYFGKKSNHVSRIITETHDVHNYLNNEDMPAIFSAIKIESVPLKTIEHLLRLGAKAKATILGGYTPIAYAVQVNRPDILELLLKNGGDPNPADKYGMRPLFYATIENKPEIVKLLIKYGSDRNASDVNGTRPLFMAYENRNFEMMRLILTDFETPQKANWAGDHILHVIAKDGCMEALECLIDCCPKMRIFDTGDVNGDHPPELARQNHHEEVAKRLEDVLGS